MDLTPLIVSAALFASPITLALEPVRAKLEEDEEVMLLWSALVFRRRADVEGRDPLYLRPQGLAVPN
jgi:hypothetical protein